MDQIVVLSLYDFEFELLYIVIIDVQQVKADGTSGMKRMY